ARERERHARAGQVAKAPVAAEQLVPAGAGQRDREPGLAHQATHEIRVDRVERRLVEARERGLETTTKALLREAQLDVTRAERAPAAAGVFGLVETGLVEADVKRRALARPSARGERRHGARIDTTGEKHAEGDVAREVLPGRFQQRGLERRHALLDGSLSALSIEHPVPTRLRSRLPRTNHER